MKTFSFALVAFTASVFAIPQGAPKGTTYTLQTKSGVETFNNKALSAKGGKVGIFPGAPPAKITSSSYDAAKTLSLHVNAEDHQLALAGKNGLLELVDVINPTGESIPQGQSMEWSTFVIDAQGNLGVKDGNEVPTRRWVAFTNTDGSIGVGLYDGVTLPQARALQNITLIAVAAR